MNKIPSYNECAKMWDICDAYHCKSHIKGWTWNEAIKFIQEHWNDEAYVCNMLNEDMRADYREAMS